MSEQIAIRLSDELVGSVNKLVNTGRFPNRATLVRAALERLIDTEQRRITGEEIAAAYRAVPPTPVEDAWAALSTKEMVTEEPW